jgi:antitoxin component of RelBE/YafQ-DinJ toxin-antitoxin module
VEEKDKDVHIQFIAPESVRKRFKDTCKKLGYSPSAWLRVQVDKLIKENEK